MESDSLITELSRVLKLHNVPFTRIGSEIEIIQLEPFGFVKYEIVGWNADPQIPWLLFSVYKDDSVVGYLDAYKLLGFNQEIVGIAEHPLTSLLVFNVHPCNTKEWLSETKDLFLWLQNFGRQCKMRI